MGQPKLPSPEELLLLVKSFTGHKLVDRAGFEYLVRQDAAFEVVGAPAAHARILGNVIARTAQSVWCGLALALTSRHPRGAPIASTLVAWTRPTIGEVRMCDQEDAYLRDLATGERLAEMVPRGRYVRVLELDTVRRVRLARVALLASPTSAAGTVLGWTSIAHLAPASWQR